MRHRARDHSRDRSRDRALVLVDARAGGGGAAAGRVAAAHTGAKPFRVAWLGATPRLFTAGFGAMSAREHCVWDARALGKGPLARTTIDHGSGIFLPLYDEDTQVVLLAAKGETAVRLLDVSGAGGAPCSVRACADFGVGSGAPFPHTSDLRLASSLSLR